MFFENDANRDELMNYLIKTRSDLNKIPEMGLKEFETCKYIKAQLDEMGYEYTSPIETSVVGRVKGKIGNKTIAFRADMDALNSNNQIRHLCGHDGHMTILLGLLKYLKINNIVPDDNIVFIFQPAEEAPGGAKPIIENGVLKSYKVEEIYGLHIYPELDEGQVGCKKGPFLARICEVDIDIFGKSAHGAAPHKGKDAILIASQFISMANGIISREVNPVNPSVLSFGYIKGGSRRNIICDNVRLEATLRAFSDDTYELIKSRIIKMAKGMELSHDCKIDVHIKDDYPAVNNDSDLYDNFKETIIYNKKYEFIELNYLMISEDFSYYQKEISGLFFMLGSKNKQKGYISGLHTEDFNFDSNVMLDGINIFLDILKSRGVIS